MTSSLLAHGVAACVACAALTAPVTGQSLVTGTEERIAGDRAGRSLVEPHLAIHPGDPAHMLVGAIAVSADLTETDCVSFASMDGGERWTRHDFGLASCGDPWGVVLDDGTAILTVLGARTGGPADPGLQAELLVYRSADGGRTWPDGPTSLGAGHDHQTVAVHRVEGRDGPMFIVSVRTVGRPDPEGFADAVFVARSQDRGHTFVTFHHLPTGLAHNTQEPVVLADGTLLIPFSDYGRRTPDGQARLGAQRDWILRSDDGGESVSPPYLITDGCGRSWSELSHDDSRGPNRGRIYQACNDADYERILVVRSDDGLSWHDPVVVNQGSGRRPYARTPALAVGAGGEVGVSFSDGRGSGSFMHVFRCQRTYFTASIDGGDSWIPEVAVSGEASCPVAPETGMAGMRFPSGGDYQGLAALPNGMFRLVWSDARSGRFELWTNTVSIEHGSFQPR